MSTELLLYALDGKDDHWDPFFVREVYMRLRSITFLLLLAVAAVGAGLEYAAGASDAKSSSSVANSGASTSDLRPSHVLATASLETSADNSHVAQIRSAHAAIRTATIGEQPPTF